jgi:hypothetical protein
LGRLRFALLHDGTRLEQWHVQCLDELEREAELVWGLAAPRVEPRTPVSGPLGRYAARIERGSLAEPGERLAAVPPPPPNGDRTVDVVLGLGNIDVPAWLQGVARVGVWRFAHELEATRLPFFGEVCRGDPVTRTALLRVSGAGELPAVVEAGAFRTDTRSYPRSMARILDGIASWPAHACRRLSAGQAGPGPPYAAPRGAGGGLVRLAAGVTARRLALAWERLFRHPQWNVGVIERPVTELLAPGAFTGEDVEWFPLDDKAGFLADPFAVERDGRLRIFYEYFDYQSSRGRVGELVHADRRFWPVSDDALSLPTHVSYPCLVELPDGLHCVPETADAGEVALYRVGEDGTPWTKAAVLLPDVPGIDPTLFRHEGRWWLLCTRQGPREDEELWAWHAASVEGPWAPHALNPVKTDVCGARPAGPPFVHDGALHRPAQDCSRAYGGRVTVHRVDELTPTAFSETEVAVLESSSGSAFPIGPHTVTAVGGRVVVDGRRRVFVPAALRAFLRIWARSAAGRVRRG